MTKFDNSDNNNNRCAFSVGGDWGAFDGNTGSGNSDWGTWTGDGVGVMEVGQIFRHGNCRLTKPLQLKLDGGSLLAEYKTTRENTGYPLRYSRDFGAMFELYCVTASIVFHSESNPITNSEPTEIFRPTHDKALDQ